MKVGMRNAERGSDMTRSDLIQFAASLPPARARMVLDAIPLQAAAAEQPISPAAAAFESDMQPVCNAIVSALEAGDLEALQGLHAILPHLLAEVNASPALADALAHQLGRALVSGLISEDLQ